MKFTINTENYLAVFHYLTKKLKTDSLYLNHLPDIDAEREALAALNSSEPEKIDSWCREYLSPKQFTALRASLRKKQSRKVNQVKTVDLEVGVYSDLNDLAANANMSIKDYLTALIQDTYKEVNPPVAKRASQRVKR